MLVIMIFQFEDDDDLSEEIAGITNLIIRKVQNSGLQVQRN